MSNMVHKPYLMLNDIKRLNNLSQNLFKIKTIIFYKKNILKYFEFSFITLSIGYTVN